MLRVLRDFIWCLLILCLVAQQSQSVQAAEWGSLSGKFVYTGPPAKQQKTPFPEPPSLIVGPQGGIKNIFVYLKERNFNPERIHPDFRKLPNLVVIEHRNQRLEPHAAALWQPHQKLVLSNQSPRVHVTQLFPLKNQRPDIAAIGPGRKETIPFEYPELLPIQIKCDIHPFETGYLLVLDHPYVSISDETGAFQIKNLPVGEWEFRVWHEQAGHLAAREEWQKGRIKIQIKPGDNDLGIIKVTPKVFVRKVAAKEPAKAGVVLTFDDRNMNQWVKQIPLFQKYNAQVTFFVDHFQTLTPQQIDALKQLKAAGHAIGCHGARHRKAVDYVRAHGMERYLKDEIDPAVKRMTDAGFPPTCFAYPSSSRNAEIDQALLKTFRHLRGGTGLPAGQRMRDLRSIYVPVDQIADRGCLIGTGIDYAGTEKRPDYLVEIKDALDHAQQRGEIVIFYAHNISDKGPGHHLQPRVLEAILAHAQQIGLATLTYDDLP